tara:strand:+ start:6080 stop:6970 length:891 start_codon:yes stop_codon:yes gene_type:complete
MIKKIRNRLIKILLGPEYHKLYIQRARLYERFLVDQMNKDQISDVIAATRSLSPSNVEVKLNTGFKNILVLSPHQDDDIIGCGGTLLKSVQENCSIQVLYIMDGASPKMHGKEREEYIEVRNKEAKTVWENINDTKPLFINTPTRSNDIDEMALASKIEDIIKKINPDCIFVPHFLELPLDHKRTSYLLWKILQKLEDHNIQEIWSYQVTTMISPNVGVDITEVESQKYYLMTLWESQNKLFNYAHRARGLNAANTFYTQNTKSKHYEPFIELFHVTTPAAYLNLLHDIYSTESPF